MNLAAIKRVDPYAKDIIDSSAHVAFYTFNAEDTEWEKTDVEGAFFVYSRNAEPFHSIFINNRLNTNSLVEPITAHIELQSQPPFLLYRNERSRIRGFWFYNRTECDRIGELVERIVKDCELIVNKGGNAAGTGGTGTLGTGAPSKPIDMAQYSNSNVDIFSMLSKAQQDFNNSLTKPSIDKNAIQTGRMLNVAGKSLSNGTNSEQTQPGAPIPIPNPPDGTSQSVMNFFAAAKPAKAKEVPFFQRLLSAPVHVDQIEKQHRVITPHNEKQSPPQANAQPVQTTYAKAVSNIENGFGFMRIHSPSQQQNADLGSSPLATFIGTNNLVSLAASNKDALISSKGPPAQAIDVKDMESHHNQQLTELLKKPAPIPGAVAASVANNINNNPTNITPHKPALMPPTMFKSTISAETNSNHANTAVSGGGTAPFAKGNSGNTNNNSVSNTTPNAKKDGGVPVINSRSQKKTSTPQQSNHQQQQQQQARSDQQSLATKPEPLTQTQLLQAMSYLIKNDPDFVRKLHEAYLKSFTEMVSL